jgi:hypothetical protein
MVSDILISRGHKKAKKSPPTFFSSGNLHFSFDGVEFMGGGEGERK